MSDEKELSRGGGLIEEQLPVSVDWMPPSSDGSLPDEEEWQGDETVAAAGDEVTISPPPKAPGASAFASGSAAARKRETVTKGDGKKEKSGTDAAMKGRGPSDAAPQKRKDGTATPELVDANAWQVAKGRRRS